MRILVFLISFINLYCEFSPRKPGNIIIDEIPIIDSLKFSPDISYDSAKIISKKLYAANKTTRSEESWKRLTNYISDTLIPFWYGTEWDFNGTTEIPKKGKIACGYFVTTILRDAGMPIQRIRLAQCASEQLVKEICIVKSIKRFRNTRVEKFLNEIQMMADGLYIVGLDFHTGFILVKKKAVSFIHASYFNPSHVINENASESSILKSSKYKILGKVNFRR